MIKKQDGIILIFLLWAIALLSFIVIEFNRQVRLKAKMVTHLIESKKDYFSSYSAVQEAMVRLSLPEDDERKLLPDGKEHEFIFDGQRISLTIEEEERKININLANAQILHSLFTKKIGFSDEITERLVDCILDYKDSDNVTRPYGAEEDYYLSLSPPYKSANGPFKTLEELLFVKNVTLNIFWKMYNFLTVYGKNVKLPEGEENRPLMIGHHYRFICKKDGHLFVFISHYLGKGKHEIIYQNEFYKP